MPEFPAEQPCPCESGQAYSQCCRVLHQGSAAQSPEALMRSRYSAFALNFSQYLLDSWHTSTRPPTIEPSPTRWKHLEILSSREDGDTGWVQFRATFVEDGHWGTLEEESRFLRENGPWHYVDGTPDVKMFRPERNSPCPCGSGRKFKKCCIGEG